MQQQEEEACKRKAIMSWLCKAKVSLPHPEIRVGGDRLGWVQMSRQDLQRVEVLTEVLAGRRTVASAAVVLAITVRQVNRLLIRLRENGGGGLIHKGRGQSSNHRLR